MLDHVERRTFPVDPAGKHPVPLAVGPLDVELQEGARQLFLLPRRAGFAGAQADHGVLDPDCLAGLEGQVANDAVALVEKADDRHSLRHGRDAGQVGGAFHRIGGDGIGLNRLAPLVRAALAAGAGEKQADGDRRKDPASHAYSGFHAS